MNQSYNIKYHLLFKFNTNCEFYMKVKNIKLNETN